MRARYMTAASILLANMHNVTKQNQVKIDIDSLQERVEFHTLIICASLKN